MSISGIFNRTLCITLFFATAITLQAQTWNGSVDSDWNKTANWSSPSAVPGPTSSVLIPAAGSITNWPKLPGDADITLNWLIMESGSQLDVNGRQLTVTGVLNMGGTNEVTIDNSAGGDIIFNLGTGGTNKLIGKVAFAKNVIFNLSGSCIFYDGYSSGATRYLGNVTYNIGSFSTFTSGNNFANEYHGNLTVVRTAAGITNLFSTYGLAALTGNFSYTNTAGGHNYINANGNPTNAAAAVIGGTVNIHINGQGAGDFTMNHIKNSTAGGAILVESVNGITMDRDTLLAHINLNGYKGVGTLYRNGITGNFILAQSAGNSTNTLFGGNHITGNTAITHNSSAAFYTGYSAGKDVFDGNVVYAINSTALFIDGNNFANEFNGNLTVVRTAAGTTNLFSAYGLAALTGNFSYTNTAGGDNYINAGGQPINAAAPIIGGTVNINVNGHGAGDFAIRHIKNSTPGGSISVTNVSGIAMEQDTLLAHVNLNGYKGLGTFYNNDITGNVTLAQSAGNAANTLFGGNHITGNTAITHNSSAAFYTGYSVGKDVFDGDFTLIKNGAAAGTITIGNNYGQDFNGNVAFSSTSGISISSHLMTFGGSNSSVLGSLGVNQLISNMRMNKTGGATLTLGLPLAIGNSLAFDEGNIISSAANYLQFNSGATHSNVSATSHVTGLVRKAGNQAFTFPVGTATGYNPVAITAPGVNTDVFSAEYKQENPNDAGYLTANHAATVQSVSRCEYWDVRRLNGNSDVKLTFTFDAPCAGSASYISDPSKLRVMHWNNTSNTWENLGNGGSTPAGTYPGTIITTNTVSSFSPFTLGSTDAASNPLAVTFGSITASIENGFLVVKWITENETNNSHFNIQVSKNGTDFTTIATVKSKAPNGTTNQVTDYEQTIALPVSLLSGFTIAFALLSFGVKKRRSLYRLTSVMLFICTLFACSRQDIAGVETNQKLLVRIVQVDMDGTKSYSKTVQVVDGR